MNTTIVVMGLLICFELILVIKILQDIVSEISSLKYRVEKIEKSVVKEEPKIPRTNYTEWIKKF